MAPGAGAALATLALLAFAGPSAAATPQQTSQKIFRDLADNGQLDGRYSDAQINRALQYGDARINRARRSPALRRYQPDPGRSEAQPAPAARSPVVADGRGPLPFSGIDLALLGGVGAPLLLIAASLGRLARVRTEGELS